ncbi:hypothetical protein ACRAQ7_10625 [Erythrobacter sp. W53]|uniref:hypothetical protein n=1 Tax=Erythrobacter sp. W53 TaxID=3425947 RepID=UPI003D76779C
MTKPKAMSDSRKKELCDAAQTAWDAIGPKETKATFTWHGKKYIAHHSNLRLMVDDHKGEPVVARYL